MPAGVGPGPHGELPPAVPASTSALADRRQHPGSASTPDAPASGGSGLSAYYGDAASSATVAFPAGEENSGSLTGHILAQGWAESAGEASTSTLRVVIVMAIALALLVGISVLVVLLANDALSSVASGPPG
ncbi:hypothetical protein Vqi01_17300 [Micromonospora qiuiae]|uniref:Uncharacterized protein n=2 Tax=Micromonospora qiuiae TaxID=502268 RepID=A0ABQ4J903_9ACTN|nr:hypothetical protein Vqi01_17300 [Micromonospora qiuiae]